MTVTRITKPHLPFAVVALVLIGCDDANTASTAPAPDAAPRPQLAYASAPKSVVVQSEKITGGGGLSLSIYEAGTPGTPPIVLIHGFTQNFLMWDEQFRGLARSFNLLTYDLRGHGASDKPLEPQLYTESSLWADDLAAVIQARNLHRPVLVGWSYGGYVIADYVRKFGDSGLGGIVFLAAVTKQGTDEAAAFFTNEVLAIFPDVLSPEVRASIDGTRALASLFTRRGSEQYEIALASGMMVPPVVRLAMFSRLLDNDDVLASIRVPTLVVQGAADRVVKPSAAQHIASTVPGARLLMYPGVGHAPYLEVAARFNRDLAEFVRSVQ